MTYYWDYGDGSAIVDTTDREIWYAWSQHGTYNITVVGMNDVSTKQNYSSIIVQVSSGTTGQPITGEQVD